MRKRKDYCVQVNPSEKLPGSVRVLGGLAISLFILAVTVIFLLLLAAAKKVI